MYSGEQEREETSVQHYRWCYQGLEVDPVPPILREALVKSVLSEITFLLCRISASYQWHSTI